MSIRKYPQLVVAGLALLIALALVSCNGGEQRLAQSSGVSETAAGPVTPVRAGDGEVAIVAYDPEGRPSQELTQLVQAEMEGKVLKIGLKGGEGKFIYLTVDYNPAKLSPTQIELADRFAEDGNLLKFGKRFREGKVAIAVAMIRPSEREPMELSGEVATIQFGPGPDVMKETAGGINQPGEPMVVINPADPTNPQDAVDLDAGLVSAELRVRGDTNANGSLGFEDMTRLVNVFGLSVGDPAPGGGTVRMADDFDGSGDIGFNDATLFVQGFGLTVSQVNEYQSPNPEIGMDDIDPSNPNNTYALGDISTGQLDSGWAGIAIPIPSGLTGDVYAAYLAADPGTNFLDDNISSTVQLSGGALTVSKYFVTGFTVNVIDNITGQLLTTIDSNTGVADSNVLTANMDIDFVLFELTVQEPDENTPDPNDFITTTVNINDCPGFSAACLPMSWPDDFKAVVDNLVEDDPTTDPPGTLIYEPSGSAIADINGTTPLTRYVGEEALGVGANTSIVSLLIGPHTGSGGQTISPPAELSLTVTLPGVGEPDPVTGVRGDLSVTGNFTIQPDPNAPVITAMTIDGLDKSDPGNAGATTEQVDDLLDVIIQVDMDNFDAAADPTRNEADCLNSGDPECGGLESFDVWAYRIDNPGSVSSISPGAERIDFDLRDPTDLRVFDPNIPREDEDGNPTPNGFYELPDTDGIFRVRFPIQQGGQAPKVGSWVLVVANKVVRNDPLRGTIYAHPSSGLVQGPDNDNLSHDGRFVAQISTNVPFTTYPIGPQFGTSPQADPPQFQQGEGGLLFIYPLDPAVRLNPQTDAAGQPVDDFNFNQLFRHDANGDPIGVSWAASGNAPIVVVQGPGGGGFQIEPGVQLSLNNGKWRERYVLVISGSLDVGIWNYRIGIPVTDPVSGQTTVPDDLVVVSGQFQITQFPPDNTSDPSAAQITEFGFDVWSQTQPHVPGEPRDLAFDNPNWNDKTGKPQGTNLFDDRYLIIRGRNFVPALDEPGVTDIDSVGNAATEFWIQRTDQPAAEWQLNFVHIIRSEDSSSFDATGVMTREAYALSVIPSDINLLGADRNFFVGVKVIGATPNYLSAPTLTLQPGT